MSEETDNREESRSPPLQVEVEIHRPPKIASKTVSEWKLLFGGKSTAAQPQQRQPQSENQLQLQPQLQPNNISSSKVNHPPKLFCMDCFNRGKPIRTFSIGRDNLSSKEKHKKNHHKNETPTVIAATLTDALPALTKWKRKYADLQASECTPRKKRRTTSEESSSSQTNGVELQPYDESSDNSSREFQPSSFCQSVSYDTILEESCSSNTTPIPSTSALSSIESVLSKGTLTGSEDSGTETPIWAKTLIKEVSSLSASLKQLPVQYQRASEESKTILRPSNDVGTISQCNSIIDVAANIDSFKLTTIDSGGCIIKCHDCDNYLNSKLTMPDRKRGSKTRGTLASGLVYNSEKAKNLLEGHGTDWHKMKSFLQEHVSGRGDTGDIHIKALQLKREEQSKELRSKKVISNLIRVSIQICKMKAAAIHFETLLALLCQGEVDVGDFGHSRKHLPALISTLSDEIDSKIEGILTSPLPSTGLPPHWWTTVDKSTPGRETNQAIMVCPIVDGKRTAFFVDAPLVYNSKDDNLEGCRSQQLAETVIKTIKKRLPNAELKFCVGVSADGQYQSQRFKSVLFGDVGAPHNSSWFDVIWDGAHWVDLAAKEASETKLLKTLFKRCAMFHTQLSRGKMHRATQIIAADMDYPAALCTKASSATRFSSSNYTVLETVYRMYAVYINALYTHGGMRRNTNDVYNELQYLVCGEDFACDLVVALDVMQPITNLMLKLQEVQSPCWKVVQWVPRVIKHLQEMLEQISDGWGDIKSKQWPCSFTHLKDIQSGTFKGVTLVPGWLVTSEDKVRGNVQWLARDINVECLEDTKDLIKKLIAALEARFEKCVSPLQQRLWKAIDLQETFTSLCGVYDDHHGRVILGCSGITYSAEFKELREHMSQLPYIQTEDESVEITHQKAQLAFQWLLYHRSDEATRIRYTIFPNTPSHHLKLVESVRKANSSVSLKPTFWITSVAEVGLTSLCELDESALISAIYKEEELYNRLGMDYCRMLDIALSKGGPETIVESLYSVMGSQKMEGKQSNEVLVDRTKVDWTLPTAVSVPKFVEDSASRFVKKHRKIHFITYSHPHTRVKAVTSKVLKRISSEKGRCAIFT